MRRLSAGNRGLTLVEVLLSLALTSSLLVLSGEWIRAALQRETASATVRDRAVLDRALDRIEDLLRSGDWQTDRRHAGERVTAMQHRLTIRSRWPGRGAVDASVTFDPASAELTLEFTATERVLVAGLADARFDIREAAADAAVIVEVTLTAADGSVARREVLVR